MDEVEAGLRARIVELEDQLLAATAAPPPVPVGPPCPFETWDTVEAFATELLAPFIADKHTKVTAQAPWCERWDLHPLAAHLIHTAYVTWPDMTAEDWPDQVRTWTTHLLPTLLAELPALLGGRCSHGSQNTRHPNQGGTTNERTTPNS